MRRQLVASPALFVALLFFCFPARTSAQGDLPTLSGSWTASALSERWTIAAWGDACGPKPQPQGASGGGVQIRQQGSELSISGAGRAWSTTDCWEQMPGLTRSKHSASGNARSWQTRCTTSANDPRRATVVTTTQATDTSITMSESGQYQFIIQDTTCSASVTRSRTYSLVRREGEAPPQPSAPPAASSAPAVPAPPAPVASEAKPATPRTCDAPGEPARLEVTPSRKLMRPGERAQFRAVVLDAAGCSVPTKPSWSIAPGPLAAAASVDPGGALSIAAGAGEGTLGLVASAFGKGVTVAIEVTSPDRYDALLTTSGLNTAGESDQAATAVIATGTIGGRTTAGEDVARERKNVFVAIVGGVAACLGFAGLVLLRRGRRGAAAGDAEAERDPSSDLADGAFAPRERGASRGPISSTLRSPGAAPTPEAVPSSELPLGTAGAAAAGAAAAGVGVGAAPAQPASRGKICPTCGDHYPGEALFCGKDGTHLVPLN